jgi:phenylalanyl-tRNA synthetase beta chain
MKTSYNWLKELVDFDWTPEELADQLTLSGTESDHTESTDKYMRNVVVGEILAINTIEGADKIRMVNLDIGKKKLDVICGAPNIKVGQKVPVALIDAELASGIIIKKTKIRGIDSEAMICSEQELGISDEHSGIMVLDTDLKPGLNLADALDYNDTQLSFDLTPNRPDSMSTIGIARDIAVLLSTKLKRPAFKLIESNEKADDYVSVKIKDVDACPRYAARIIKNVKIAESPWWLKKKLILSGVRPISNVVDITNFVMMETGHPLHAFDYDRFGSKEVVVRRAKDKEKFTTLDGVEHECTTDVLLITNGKDGVAAGGVMGGLDSEVEEDTTNILLEAAYFDPSVIRKSRKKLGFVTESSTRFEKGVDPNGINNAIDRAAYLMNEICHGEVLGGVVDCYPNYIEPAVINFRPERCNSLLGVDIPKDSIVQILTDLEFGVEDGDNLKVTVPTFRPDVTREVDLIEEVARIYGYDKIPSSIKNVGPLYTPKNKEEAFRQELRTVITASGFDEILSHGLADKNLAEFLNPDHQFIAISNPISEELNIMRSSLIQTALSIVNHNINHRSLDLCLFEIGKVYSPPTKKSDWKEDYHLSLIVSGNTPHTWRETPRPYDFYDLTGLITSITNHFKWNDISYKPQNYHYFNDDISFDIYSGDTKIGNIGQISSSTAKKFDIKQNLFVAELNAELLMDMAIKTISYKELPIYPAALRDLAIVVDENIKAGEMVDLIKSIGGEIAEKVEIFDLYTGKQIEKGKKSIAISINYRSIKGNLSSAEVEEAQAKVVSELKNKFKAIIREK